MMVQRCDSVIRTEQSVARHDPVSLHCLPYARTICTRPTHFGLAKALPETFTVKIEDSFRYCPRCGLPRPRILAGRQLLCSACGLRFFFNTAAAAGAFIFHGGRLLLCERAEDPGKGLLDIPGGFIEFNETIEDGLRREIAEELHLEVTRLRYLTSAPNDYVYAGVPYKTADTFFVCEAVSPEALQAADDVAAVRWLFPQAVDDGQFAFASARQAFRALLEALGPAADQEQLTPYS